MSTWTGITVGEFELCSMQVDYEQWYFRNSDRIRDIVGGDKDGDHRNSFIGYRAEVGKIRRRMELQGYHRESLERHFRECLANWQEAMEKELTELNSNDFSDNGGEGYPRYYELRKDWLMKALPAIAETTLDDWLERLPLAAAAEVPESHQLFAWNRTSDPLLSLMTSDFDRHNRWVLAGGYSFPCTDPEFYACAVLLASNEATLCELDLTELICDELTEDFTDLEELHAGKTLPFRHACQSMSELGELASAGTENTILIRMCYSGIITVMEAYLADIFIRAVKQPSIQRRFVEKYEKYRKGDKFTLSELYTVLENLDKTIEEELNKLTFHNIATVTQLWKVRISRSCLPKLTR